VPASNVKELIAHAKARPGQLNFAIAGTGSAPHLAGIEFTQRTGLSWAYIPYKGGAQAVLDVVAGQADVLFNGMLATYGSVKNGKLKALGVSSAKRVAAAPDLPTISEQGLPGFETGSWQGVVAAPGTPREIVLKINAEIARILNTQDMKDKLAAQGTEVRADTPESFAVFIRDEKTRWAKVVKESGAKFD
jgi:tripartite-type tricarboxylate transporter receptor subunit TctC